MTVFLGEGILRRILLLCLILGFLGSCSASSTNSHGASNETGTDTGEEQRTTVSQTVDTEETTIFSSSLTVTTTDTEEAEDLTFVDTDGDGSSDYRAYLRYENYLEREDVSSVYIWIATSPVYKGIGAVTKGDYYSSEIMSDVLEQLPHYDFVLLSVYSDYTGDYLGPLTYIDNAEVAGIYNNHLREYADEFANAVMEGENPTEVERYERRFREGIPRYDYRDSEKILTGPNIPPWVYSDREAETLGELPGLEGRIDSTITDHYEAIRTGNFEEAYSYFSSTYRSTTDMETWIEEQESNSIVKIHDSEATAEVTSQDSAIAFARVSFEDSIHDCDNIYLCSNPSDVTWELVKEGEEWKLDELLSVEVDEIGIRMGVRTE